ncbi:hypothetical protein FW755_12645 [Lonepinella koalarum]|uniref:hypothetical protein n=1 Tax=Lonepinella koalarum TaxID=53417 RepID=UPI0011E4ADE5|nr:hypothetical protein [Lonepinella koalarum]TYG33276.1 hypothetical protein FW755_12645 [Lonepinella koalarum]
MIYSVKLTDVADIESRPSKNKIYPVGTIIIQVSATRGQILFLHQASEIGEQYAIIRPKNIDSFYLYSVIEKFFPKFFQQRKQGLNIRSDELKHFSFPIHKDKHRQNLIGLIMRKMAGQESFYGGVEKPIGE